MVDSSMSIVFWNSVKSRESSVTLEAPIKIAVEAAAVNLPSASTVKVATSEALP